MGGNCCDAAGSDETNAQSAKQGNTDLMPEKTPESNHPLSAISCWQLNNWSETIEDYAGTAKLIA
jgi:hypothetical protein